LLLSKESLNQPAAATYMHGHQTSLLTAEPWL